MVEKIENSTIQIGTVEVEKGYKPFVIGVDTFDGTDWFDGWFDTEEEAINHARTTGEEMLKKHAYNKNGKHIEQGGRF